MRRTARLEGMMFPPLRAAAEIRTSHASIGIARERESIRPLNLLIFAKGKPRARLFIGSLRCRVFQWLTSRAAFRSLPFWFIFISLPRLAFSTFHSVFIFLLFYIYIVAPATTPPPSPQSRGALYRASAVGPSLLLILSARTSSCTESSSSLL